MTSTALVATPVLPTMTNNWPRRLAVVALLVALADWLMFRHSPGISAALMILAVSAGVVTAKPVHASRRVLLFQAGILVAAVAPMIEDLNLLSALISVAGLAAFTLAVNAPPAVRIIDKLAAIGWLLIDGPWQIFRDMPQLKQWAQRSGPAFRLTALKGWIVPLAFGAVFLLLFAAANPVIDNWLEQLRDQSSLVRFDLSRLLFWIAAILALWTFVCICGDRYCIKKPADPVLDRQASDTLDLIFNESTVRRSLILFNLLFAVQTAMDIHYLWRGAELPDGMSHASYAHRGAYPLIVTALLAATFVIAAMRPGSAAERSASMRALVFVWVGQNVLLVVSSILRLDLYVATYFLTYWRVAAFIWMLLVAAGLILIVARIVLGRSNAWLISANLATLALTLYLCSWIDFAGMIARYNVDHARPLASEGRPLDHVYLIGLGPNALPAMDRYIAVNPLPYMVQHRDRLALRHRTELSDWRAWSFRGWRLKRYLDRRDAEAT